MYLVRKDLVVASFAHYVLSRTVLCSARLSRAGFSSSAKLFGRFGLPAEQAACLDFFHLGVTWIVAHAVYVVSPPLCKMTQGRSRRGACGTQHDEQPKQ